MVKYICSVDRGIVISYDKDIENVSTLDNFYVDYMYISLKMESGYIQKRMALKKPVLIL